VDKSQIVFPLLAIAFIAGNGIRMITMRADYAARFTSRQTAGPWLIGFSVALGIIQLAVALPIGYLVFSLFE
jgi:succinate dehydrogenase/fumarate reductase cytochrome b subunit